MAQEQLCTQCGTVGFMKQYTKGSMLTEIVLWLFFLLPGLIYSLWRATTNYWGCPQCASPNVIRINSPNAQKFFTETKPGQPISSFRAPVITKKPTSGKMIILSVVCVFAFIFWILTVLISNPSLSNGQSTAAVTPSDDVQRLISICGSPDVDDSTAYDTPRPPIPSRFLTYKKAHLKFAYVPGGDGSRVGDPPPYRWKFIGLIDTRTQKAVRSDKMVSIVANEMHCYIGK